MIKIFLDDCRLPSHVYKTSDSDWVIVKTAEETIHYLSTGQVSHLSLDNDLGDDQPEGYTVVDWMIKYNIWPTDEVYVHSQNVVRRQYMISQIQKYYYSAKGK